jgi:hypothetical protein
MENGFGSSVFSGMLGRWFFWIYWKNSAFSKDWFYYIAGLKKGFQTTVSNSRYSLLKEKES